MGNFRTGVECFLCSSTVPYSLADTSRLAHHLRTEHGAHDGLEFLMAGCTMAQKERDAVQAVVHGRKPTLVRIQVEQDEDVDDPFPMEPEVHLRVDEAEEPLQERSSRSPGDGVSPPRMSPARRKQCPDCSLSFKLQIQLNRHKQHCVKREGGLVLKSETKPKKLFSPATVHRVKRRHSLGTQVIASAAERKRAYPRGGGNNKLVPPTGTGIPCTECGKEFFSRSRMLSHFVDLHQPGHFPCPGQGCGKVFSSLNKQSSHYSKQCNPNTESGRSGLVRRGVMVPQV